MTKREFRQNFIKKGESPKRARMHAAYVAEIFRMVRRAAMLERKGRHTEALEAAREVVEWIKSMNALVEALTETLLEEEDEE